MTYEEKRQRNNQIFKEWHEATLRGEVGINEKLAKKYNVDVNTIYRIRREARKRLTVEVQYHA